MIDKVQRIREEVERLKLCTMDEHMKFYSEAAEAEYNALCKVEKIIDSLQEEPVSVWHNASEEPNDMSHCLIFYGCKESVGHYLHYEPVLYNKKEKVFVTSSFQHPTGYKRDRISISDITQWCYLCDLHNFSNVERTGKDWKEEPVSEDLEKAALLYYPKMSRISEPHGIIPADYESYYLGDANEDNRKAFKTGAQWREHHFVCPCECSTYKDGYKNGMKDMKQQMMKNTMDAVCYVTHYEDETQVAYSVSYPKGEETDKYHDKVKLIIIKEG